MAFGLLTALNVDDIPKILHRVARGYRGTETRNYQHAWQVAADELDKFADELVGKIEEAKLVKTPVRRIRL